MSSGACRALVAVLLTLVAIVVMALPVVAEEEALREGSTITYKVDPSRGVIDVKQTYVLTTRQSPWQEGRTWGPIIVEQAARPAVSGGFEIVSGKDLPLLWEEINVTTPRIPGGQQRANFVVEYRLTGGRIAGDRATKAETPARVDASYFYFCVPGQDTDNGKIIIEVTEAPKWKITQSGTDLQKTNRGLASDRVGAPNELFTCVEGVREGRLEKDTFVGPAGRAFELQAWKDDSGWLIASEDNAKPVLDAIHRELGYDIPGEGTVVIRQAPPSELGGYAGAHDTPGIIQLDESGGSIDPEHDLAHAWFSTDNYPELWLREAMALWTASKVTGDVCAAAGANTLDLDLSDWQVVRPTSGSDWAEVVTAQDAAACGIVSAVAERMPAEQWQEVLGSLINAETKYIGRGGPDLAATPAVNYQEWLDAVDERGLVPAGHADLDYAQNLLQQYGIGNRAELMERSEARARYHQFLEEAAPLGAPLAVRKNMDDWRFRDAMAALVKSEEVLGAILEADAQIEGASLIPFIQVDFEAARNVRELDEVLDLAQDLLDRAREAAGPLGELRQAGPPDWGLPAVIRGAINRRDFEGILDAIDPAKEAVVSLVAADAALPNAGILDEYQSRYEASSTVSALERLVSDAAQVERDAVATGRALSALESEVGEWRIPDVVTTPIEGGDIKDGRAVIEDARAVVAAAKEGDLALPNAQISASIRPLFEAVTDAVGMAALREAAQARRDEAVAVGSAVDTLNNLVPDWQIPAIVTQPIEDREFETAALTAAAAERWIRSAWQADQDWQDFGALDRIKDDFESAQTLEELETGADLAEQWSEAADHVGRAIAAAEAPRDLLTEFGLIGVDIKGPLQATKDAALAGEVSTTINKSAEVQQRIADGASSGSLRLAGVVFFGVAVLGVLGLWVMLRRQAGPSWARSSTPHWVEDRKRLPWQRDDGNGDDSSQGPPPPQLPPPPPPPQRR